MARRTLSLALLTTVCLVGSAAGAAATGWHVTPVRTIGKGLGGLRAAEVNRFGTSILVFSSRRSLAVVRRTAHGSRFETVGRASVYRPSVISLTAIADGRFLLVYTTRHRLVARAIDRAGHFRGKPHLLATGYTLTGNLLFPATPALVSVESDASRAVVVWGVTHGMIQRVEGAIDDRAGWSSSKILYAVKSSQPGLFRAQLAHDSQDRFLVSLHGANGDTTDRVWTVAGGSQQWERVTPPQVSDGSLFASYNGAAVASVDGAITAAWQDASAAVVVSTWNGSTWTTPVTAIAGIHGPTGPDAIYPVFVSDGSRAALVWSEPSPDFLGPVEATIRSSPGGSWSAPLVFPHSHGSYWVPPLSIIDTFWFTASGDLAGVWGGDPITGSLSTGQSVAGLYVGHVGVGGASATVLSRTQGGTAGRIWVAMARAGGLHTVVWADGNGREFSATVTGDGVLGARQRLHLCRWPYSGVSNPDATTQLLIGGAKLAGRASACSAVLLW